MLNDEENTIVVQFRIYKRKQKKETNMRRVHENNHATAAIISSYNLQKATSTKSTYYDGCYYIF